MELITKCSNCLAEIRFADGKNQTRCPACGRVNDRPKTQGNTMNSMKRANELWTQHNFLEAEKLYQSVLAENLDEHEARWGLLMCKYGVEYVNDSRTGRRYPTCRIAQNSAFSSEPEFLAACELASPDVRKWYEEDGRYIDDVQAEIRRLADDEEAYDVFLSYKETDEYGDRTEDSINAQEVYNELNRSGYRVFYAPESLSGKLGSNYEAAIFHAIQTSQVMLVFGSRADYFNSTWVRSEWKRFLDRMDSGERKRLIPLYRDMEAYELPKEFLDRRLQAMNMKRLSAMLDVLSFLEKFVQKDIPEPEPVIEEKDESAPPEWFRQFQDMMAQNARAEAEKKSSEQPDMMAQIQAIMQQMQQRQPVQQPIYNMEMSAQNVRPVNPQPGYNPVIPNPETPVQPVNPQVIYNPVVGEPSVIMNPEIGPALKPVNPEVRPAQPAQTPVHSGTVAGGTPSGWGDPTKYGDPEWMKQANLLYGKAKARLNSTGGREHGLTDEQLHEMIETYRRAGSAGVGRAQFTLGEIYETGLGVSANIFEANNWYRRAINTFKSQNAKGDGRAAYYLGMIYRDGKGVAPDGAEAIRCLRFALESSAPDTIRSNAARILADMYCAGKRCPQDLEAGLAIYREWAQNGDSVHQLTLGQIYEQGVHGVQKDLVEAQRWLKMSAYQGDGKTKDAYERVMKALAPQAAEITRRAMSLPEGAERDELIDLAVDLGDAKAVYELACRYKRSGDNEAARRWMNRASEKGVGDASFDLADMYIVDGDNNKARELCELAVKQGLGAARCNDAYMLLGDLYYHKNTFVDAANAAKWYKKLPETAAFVRAFQRLAEMAEAGKGMTASDEEALRWYRKADKFGGRFKADIQRLEKKLEEANAESVRKAAEELRSRMEAEKKRAEEEQKKAEPKLLTAEEAKARAAELLNQGYEFSKAGDNVRAAEAFRQSAELGNAEAMYHLALCYLAGSGVKMNSAESYKWNKKAADLNHADACYECGKALRLGLGVQRDNLASGRMYCRAVELGTTYKKLACKALDEIIVEGRDLPRNADELTKWATLAASGGDADVLYSLGRQYEKGENVACDPAKAKEMYRLAANQGHAEAMCSLGMLLYFDGKDYNAKKEGWDWAEKAANADSSRAKSFLNNNAMPTPPPKKPAVDPSAAIVDKLYEDYLNGKLQELNSKPDEFPTIRNAAQTGNAKAQYLLGCWNELELKNYSEALRLYTASAEQNNIEAMRKLTEMYQFGRGVERNDAEANSWSMKAAALGEESAMRYLQSKAETLQKMEGYTPELIRVYTFLAEYGDSEARYNLGHCYDFGDGVPVNDDLAYKWYRASAAQGNPKGQNATGYMYKVGRGVEKNGIAARDWYLKAAEQGHVMAMNNLGILYRDGLNVASVKLENGRALQDPEKSLSPNPEEAVKWFRKAAEGGYLKAMVNLAEMCEKGQGTVKDYAEAMKWYRKAAVRGDAYAMYSMGWMYGHGLGVDRDDAEALKWYRQAAEKNSPSAEVEIGKGYEFGYGVTVDMKQARIWYTRAAEHGHAAAQYYLGAMLLREGNQSAAMEYFRRSADQDDAYALCALGSLLDDKGDANSAFQKFNRAAQLGHAEGLYRTGRCYEMGRGAGKDMTKAVEFYQQAVDKGNSEAMTALGECYLNGVCVPKDVNKAYKLFNDAGAQKASAHNTYLLGYCIAEGLGAAMDKKEALRLLKLAKAGGDKDAAAYLKAHLWLGKLR